MLSVLAAREWGTVLVLLAAATLLTGLGLVALYVARRGR